MHTQSTQPILAMTALDLLIFEKKSSGELFSFEKKTSVTSLEELRGEYYKEMKHFHPATVVQFNTHCVRQIKEIFPGKIENPPEEYFPLITMFAGYYQALAEISKRALFLPTSLALMEHLNFIFAEEQFIAMQQRTQELYADFLQETAECKEDFTRKRTKQEIDSNQFTESFVQDVVAGIQTGKDLMDVLRPYSNQDSISKLTGWWAKDQIHKVIASPAERLFDCIVKMLLYMNTLHNAGYIMHSESSFGDFTTWRKIA